MKRLSPSNIAAFLHCPRQWFIHYKWGWDSPAHPAAALGTAIHKELEDYFNFGTLPTTPNAVTALRYAPARSESVVIESKLVDMSVSGIPCTGRIDLTTPGLIIDWKTTKSKKFAKTDADLVKDPQAILYAADHRQKYGVAPLVKLVYISTGTWGDTNWEAKHQWTDESLDAALAYLERIVGFMQRFYALEDLTDLPCRCQGNCKICSWQFACGL
jgi:RecB family exonuclease